MKISDHADHTEKLFNLRAEDIHKWIDGYFDRESFNQFLQCGETEDYHPYDHRKFRHCREALSEAYSEFSHKYSNEQIKSVFECHIKDDYDNYIPSREDFTNGTFSEKYHESEMEVERILTTSELNHYFKNLHYRRNNQKPVRTYGFLLRIVVPAAISLILFFSSIFFVILPLFHKSLMAEKEEMIKEISSVAISIVDYYISQEKDGSLNREQAQSAVIDEIGKLRYGPDNDHYFWITDKQPLMLMHPWRNDLTGQDLSEYRDNMNRSGKKLFVESVQLVEEQGGGFLEYLWQMDEDDSRIVPKLSYVQGVDQWDWIIGTGMYIHDVEEEISRLTRYLVIILLIISTLMIFILIYIILQSHRIEKNRLSAESGLIEAKERYRALVEASNEGYMLRLNNQNVFINPTLKRMTGYGEQELLSQNIWGKLFPFEISSKSISDHLDNLKKENPDPDEFEVSLQCHGGRVLDVIISISRIFLSLGNGYIISFRPIFKQQISASLFIDPNIVSDPEYILNQINTTENCSQIVQILTQLPQAVRSMLFQSAGSCKIREFISKVYQYSIRKILELSIKEFTTPPVKFAFLSLGSSGREEMTLFSDQDNAIVFAFDGKTQDIEKIRLYFLKLADRVCSLLNNGGFSYCPGGIMAINPARCLSVEEWSINYSRWLNQSDPDGILDIHVFFDVFCAWGEKSLVDNLQSHIFSLIRNNPEFLGHFARNCLQYKVNLNLFGSVKTETRAGQSVVNIKESLIPLINFVRIYAIKYELSESSTLARIRVLTEMEIFSDSTMKDIVESFEFLWELRFSNQILSHGELRKVNDDLILSSLTHENRKRLQKSLSVISILQSRLSYDFLSVDLS